MNTTQQSRSRSWPQLGPKESRVGFDSAFADRVRLYLKVTFIINVCCFLVSAIVFLAGGDAHAGGGDPHLLGLMAGVTAVNGMTWYLIWRAPQNFIVSIITSGVTTVALSLAYTYLATYEYIVETQTTILFALLIVFIVLVLRSSLVPSPAVGTAFVGSLSLAWPVYQSHPNTADAGWVFFVWVLLLAGIIVTVTTVTSRIVYSMEEKMFAVAQMGQYKIERLIGRGGMGEVYLATHALLRRPTAVKLLLDASTASARERFRREVQTASSLTHPNTVEIYDYGRTPEGVFYFAMELVEGASLAEIVQATGSMPPSRVVQLITQAAGALGEAHTRGLVHRDVKPSNLMLCERGGVLDTLKVMDFGLVRDIAPTHENGGPGLSGTPLFIAPESILEADGAIVQSDVYALGATAYFLLTGRPPFIGDSLIEILSDHLAATPAPLDCEDEMLAELIQRCLAKEPSERPANAGELAAALRECATYGDWTQHDAAVWWAEHGPVVSAHASSQQARLTKPKSGT